MSQTILKCHMRQLVANENSNYSVHLLLVCVKRHKPNVLRRTGHKSQTIRMNALKHPLGYIIKYLLKQDKEVFYEGKPIHRVNH